ncbi:hypothetical protein KTAU_03100 [Thermogemmatispora aurantia]|jgi:hypothetical protein|uniref:Uncharacterized protein n=1 Tax=Thermogemmatispora aurantia TaxID=2045279 RepID=A0A5J4K3H3_9CHLR|nr:hypothetical protein KTAU_03100 [Thermogemmatispora aurantia]
MWGSMQWLQRCVRHKKTPGKQGSSNVTLLIPLILRNVPPELAPFLLRGQWPRRQMGCRASSGRFPPPLWMRADLTRTYSIVGVLSSKRTLDKAPQMLMPSVQNRSGFSQYIEECC